MAATSLPGIGLLKGLGVTVKHLLRRPSTQMYPHERPDLAPRTRGVIALMDENCTVCMLCARECPDWCIYIDSHKEVVPPAKEGGRPRTRNLLDRFAIDFSLCMYCGICVEVCPFDALFWSPEFEYSEVDIDDLLHEMDALRDWADTVPPPPALDDGAHTPIEVSDAITAAEREREKAAAAAAQAVAATTAPAAPKPGTPQPAPPKRAEVKVEAGKIDQETFDRLLAEGKTERIARAKAKAAWVRKEKARLRAEEPAADADAPAAEVAPESADAPVDAAAADADAAPSPRARSLSDVEVEGTGEIDQETLDRLLAEGVSERVARAKAKAAWIKQRKRQILDEEGGA